jgi:hypothetical protein
MIMAFLAHLHTFNLHMDCMDQQQGNRTTRGSDSIRYIPPWAPMRPRIMEPSETSCALFGSDKRERERGNKWTQEHGHDHDQSLVVGCSVVRGMMSWRKTSCARSSHAELVGYAA